VPSPHAPWYEIERLADRRIRVRHGRPVTQYLVKWLGHSAAHNQWYDLEGLPIPDGQNSTPRTLAKSVRDSLRLRPSEHHQSLHSEPSSPANTAPKRPLPATELPRGKGKNYQHYAGNMYLLRNCHHRARGARTSMVLVVVLGTCFACRQDNPMSTAA
jgi:hypothetical protein